MPAPSESSSRRRVAVVGGGIAGLAAAHALARADDDLDVVVLESMPRPGGKLRVSEVAGAPVDAGAESMLNARPEVVDLAREVGLGDELVYPATTSAAIWSRGAVRPMPPTVLGIPADLAALVRSGIVSTRGVARARLESGLPRLRSGADLDAVSVAAVVSKRLGREVVDRLVEPLLGGVYAGHADRLSLRAAAPQIAALVDAGPSLLAAARVSRRRAESTGGPVFAGIRGGVARLADAIVAASGVTVRTGAPVRELHRVDDRWRLVIGSTRDAEALDADAVILATPAAPTARLLGDAAPQVAYELRRIEYASMAIVTLAFPRPEEPPVGSGFLVPPVEGKTIKAATYSGSKWSWVAEATDALIVRASIGRHGEERVLQRDDCELVEAAAADLRDAAGLHGPLIDARVTRWGGALPQYALGHRARVDRIRSAMTSVPRVELCGAAYDGIGLAACVADGTRAADRVLAALRSQRTMAP
ncbi:MAG TPA: protoporphyrinogen oxidase [Nocardioidaceae bacterium]|nr:protoporphyrinogen oxidase [Nocardioidaceae bacterium]